MGKKYALVVKGRIEAEVRDKNGRLVQKHSQPMHSFTSNFAKVLANLFSLPATVTSATASPGSTYPATYSLKYQLLGQDGTLYTMTIGTAITALGAPVTFSPFFGLSAPAGDASYGLLVGRGVTPPKPDDYKLEAPYTEGSSTGQLAHGACTVEAPAVSGNTTVFRVIRTFTNNATVAQTVSESGLIAWHYIPYANTSTSLMYLIARDVWTTSVSVPSGSTLTVRYVIQITT